MEKQYHFNRQSARLKEQIQKLKIQNIYHRQHIQNIFKNSDPYRNNQIKKSKIIIDYQKDEAQRNYLQKQQLLRQIKGYKIKLKQYQEIYGRQTIQSTNRNLQYQFNSLKDQNQSLLRRLDHANNDIGKLKDSIDQKLIQNGINSRQSSCTIQKAIWLIQILNTKLLQYRKDMQTIRIQKKELAINKQKYKLLCQNLEHQKNHLFLQMKSIQEKLHINLKNNLINQSYPHSRNSKFNKLYQHNPIQQTLNQNQSQGDCLQKFKKRNRDKFNIIKQQKSLIPKLYLNEQNEQQLRNQRKKIIQTMKTDILKMINAL